MTNARNAARISLKKRNDRRDRGFGNGWEHDQAESTVRSVSVGERTKGFGAILSITDDGSWRMSSERRTGPPSSFSPALTEIKRSTARYLFAISVLSRTNEERITTGELREFLGLAPASVTEMISKLDDRELADYEKYQGVTLTSRGEALATQAAWRFCVVSTFFDSGLDADLDEQTVFDVAYTLPRDGVFALRNLVSSPCLDLCPESDGGCGECLV